MTERKKFSPEERDRVFEKCLKEYGDTAQMDMLIEEMSELIQAVMKWRRAGNSQARGMYRTHIIEELADVKIMARQMEILFDCTEELEGWIDYKVERQIGRLAEKIGGAENE